MTNIVGIRKMIIIISLCVCAVILGVAVFIKDDFVMFFRRGVSLSYEQKEMEYARIGTSGHSSNLSVKIYDPETINQIISYINSLKIVETEQPNYLTEVTLKGDLESFGFITIYFANDTEWDNDLRPPGDIIQFKGKYLLTSYEGRDWEGKCYYVKDFNYDNKTNSNNMYQFLRKLLGE